MAGERTVRVRFGGDAKGLRRAAAEGEQSMNRWQKGIAKAGAKAKGAALAAGAAVGVALASGVAAGLEQSKTAALLAAQLGATGGQAATLGKATGALYAKGVVGSVGESADAIKAAIQNALVPKGASVDAIDAVATKIANLSTVMQEDAGRVSAAVSQMIRTGMVKSAEEGFDLLQRGVEMGVNKSGDLLDTFNEYGTQFRRLGIEGPAALGLMSQAIQAGARDSDVAADALKEFANRSTDGSKAAAESFRALGFDAEKMTAIFAKGGPESAAALDQVLDRLRATAGQSDAAQISFGLFGPKAEDLGDALYALDPSAATAGLGDLSGAADRAGKALEDSAGAKVESLKRKLRGGVIQALTAAAEWVEKNEGTAKALGVALAAVAATILTVNAAMKLYSAGVAVVRGVQILATAAQWAWNVAMAANPIGLVVAAILILIGIIVLIATKTTWFQTIWKVVWGGIKAAALAVGRWFRDTLWPWMKSVWENISKAAGKAKDFVVDKFNAFVGFFKGLPKKISAAASGLFNGVKDAFRNAINWIIDKWNGLSFSLPSVNIPGIGSVGGGTLSTRNLPRLAAGGPARKDRTYLVGENGPELFTPAVSGNVTPNGQIGGDTHVYVTIDGQQLEGRITRVVRDRDRGVRRRVLAGAGTP